MVVLAGCGGAANSMSEQIPETHKGSWFGSISRKRKQKDVPQPTSETPVTEEPPNIVPEVVSVGGSTEASEGEQKRYT